MNKTSTICPSCFNGIVDTTKRRKLMPCSNCKTPFYVLTSTRVISNLKRKILSNEKRAGKVRKVEDKKKENNILLGVSYRKVEIGKVSTKGRHKRNKKRKNER